MELNPQRVSVGANPRVGSSGQLGDSDGAHHLLKRVPQEGLPPTKAAG